MYFFTADEHYGHARIIKYCNRPFENVGEMDEILIDNHNSVVGKNDTVVHAGDFAFGAHSKHLNRLNGMHHIFLKGSHDRWLRPIPGSLTVSIKSEGKKTGPFLRSSIWEKTIEGYYIVVCHYAMRVWARSHYNSWQLYGHSHGRLAPIGKQWDIGVDNNNYFPVSFEELKKIMESRPDNPNFISRCNPKGGRMETWCDCPDWLLGEWKNFKLENASFCPFCGEKLVKEEKK
jgi:calcineurin-like phosphoesterase family protein